MTETRPSGAAAGSWATWALALFFLVAIDLAITRTPFLWSDEALAHDEDPQRVIGAQCYRAARNLFVPDPTDRPRVMLLGSSRALFALWNEEDAESAVRAVRPGLEVRLDNLSVLGAKIHEIGAITQSIGSSDPDLVFLALGPAELLTEATPEHPVNSMFARGFRDPPGAPPGWAPRLDRWARSLWPLYRHREFARAAIEDAVTRRRVPERPARFSSRRELFEYLVPERGAELANQYARLQRAPSLRGFAQFVRRGRPGHFEHYVQRVAAYRPIDDETRSVVDATLARLARRGTQTRILLMPESPLLAADRSGRFQRTGVEDDAVAALEEIASLYGVEVIDGRHWLPADRFLDFDHLLPSMSGFEDRLAEEIARAFAG